MSLIRPLLEVQREEVLKYLDELGQHYQNDPSNASHDFARNRLRHELLPLLREKYNPEIDAALHRLSQLAGDAQRVMEHWAEELLDRCLISPVGDEIRLNVSPLASSDPHLRREVFIALWQRMGWPLQSMGFAEWNLLAQMVLEPQQSQQPKQHRDPSQNHSPMHKRVFPGNIVAERKGDQILLTR